MFREYSIFSLKAAAADINRNKVIARPPFESHSQLGMNPSMLDLRRTGRCHSIFFNALHVHGHFLKYIKNTKGSLQTITDPIRLLGKIGFSKKLKIKIKLIAAWNHETKLLFYQNCKTLASRVFCLQKFTFPLTSLDLLVEQVCGLREKYSIQKAVKLIRNSKLHYLIDMCGNYPPA